MQLNSTLSTLPMAQPVGQKKPAVQAQPQQTYGLVINHFPDLLETKIETTSKGTLTKLFGRVGKVAQELVGTVFEPHGTVNEQVIVPSLGKDGKTLDNALIAVVPEKGNQAAFVARNTQASLPNGVQITTNGKPLSEQLSKLGRSVMEGMKLYTPYRDPEHPIVAAASPFGGEASRAKLANKNFVPWHQDGSNPTTTFAQGLARLGIPEIILPTSPKTQPIIQPLITNINGATAPLGGQMGDTKQGLLSAARAMEANPNGLYMQVFPDAAVNMEILAREGTKKIKQGADAVILATPVSGNARKDYGLLELGKDDYVRAIAEQVDDVSRFNDPAPANTGGLLLSNKAFRDGLDFMQKLPAGHSPDDGSAAKSWWQKTPFLQDFKVAHVESPFVDFGNEGGNTLMQLHTPGKTLVKGAEQGPLSSTTVHNQDQGGRFVVMPKETVTKSLATYGVELPAKVGAK